MRQGPRFRHAMRRLSDVWQQGEHVIVSGPTGSGKTIFGRAIDQIRIDAGGHVVLFVGKLQEDPTITQYYKGWTRWKEFKSYARPSENKILLWPDVSKEKTIAGMRKVQREVFADALDKLAKVGRWTVDFDEGLYMCHPSYMGLAEEIGMLHALGRSSKLTVITKMQRPSNVPLIIYGSASHAFVGQVREQTDMRRLAELGSGVSSRQLIDRLASQGRHDFTWFPVAQGWPPQALNYSK